MLRKQYENANIMFSYSCEKLLTYLGWIWVEFMNECDTYEWVLLNYYAYDRIGQPDDRFLETLTHICGLHQLVQITSDHRR